MSSSSCLLLGTALAVAAAAGAEADGAASAPQESAGYTVGGATGDPIGSVTLGVTWRLNPASRIMVNHVREGYDRPLRQTPSGTLEDSSNARRMRVQADF